MIPTSLGDKNFESDAERIRTLLGLSTAPGGAVNHSSLLGLGNDDHLQYVHISAARTITAQHSFSPGSAQAPFVLGANAQGQTVTGLKADQLNKSVLAGTGLSGGGALTSSPTLSLDQGFAPTWTARHTFSLGIIAPSIGPDASHLIGITGTGGKTATFTGGLTIGADTSITGGGTLALGGFTLTVPATGTLVLTTRTIGVSGTGLSGGGDLSANRTVTLTSTSDGNANHSSILASDGSGDLTLHSLTLAGTFTPGTSISGHLIPTTVDTYDLGSSTKLWRKGWLSEMDALLFAKNTISVVGGYMLIAHSEGTLAADAASGATTIDFGTNAIVANDFIIFRAAGAVEYVKALSVSSGNIWNVTRNLDGSGANTWPAGSVWVDLGNSANSNGGRIELNAFDTPRISVIKQGAAYNASTELVRIGDVNGLGGASVETYGFYAGDGTNYFRYDPATSPNFQIIAGAGSVTLDANGLNITPAAVAGYATNAGISWGTPATPRFAIYGNALTPVGSTAQRLSIESNKDIAGLSGDILLTAWSPDGWQSQFGLFASNGNHFAYLAAQGATFDGLLIGAAGGGNAMLDVRGDAQFTGSITLSTPLGARAYHNANQSIATATNTVLALNSERWDTDTIHDTVTNNSRLTCKTAGKYLIVGNGTFAASTAGSVRQLAIRLNGSTYIAAQGTLVANATAQPNIAVTTIYDLAVNDYVELVAFQDTGGALNIVTGGNYSPEFSMVRLT